jgi:hypothetical protein
VAVQPNSTQWLANRGATVALAGLDPDLRATLDRFGVLDLLNVDQIYPTAEEAVAAFLSSSQVSPQAAPPGEPTSARKDQ